MDAIAPEFVSRLALLRDVFTGFGIEVVLAALIFLHYRRFGHAVSSQQSFGPVLPFVALTTFLVITVVKASFALSLGLVGALSIVRFRTPVKDPEELAYIFLAIASGIGAAAGALLLTACLVPMILLIKTLGWRTLRVNSENVFLSIDVSNVIDVEAAFAAVRAVVRANSASSSFIRCETHGDVLHLTGQVVLSQPEAMPRITSEIRRTYPATSVTFYDESGLPTP